MNLDRLIVRTPSKVPDSTQIWRKFRGSRQRQFLTDRGDATILIKIDRKRLDHSRLILPNDVVGDALPRAVKSDERTFVPTIIPYVEAWYKGAVPKTEFTGFVVLKGIGRGEFVVIENSPEASHEVDEVATKWIEAAEQERRERHARGEFTIGEQLDKARGER